VEIEVGPSMLDENGRSNTSSSRPGLAKPQPGDKMGEMKVQLILDTSELSGNIFGSLTTSGKPLTESIKWQIVPHEFYHAVEYEADITSGKPRQLIPDLLSSGTVVKNDSSVRSKEAYESRAVRFSNIMAKEAGQKAMQEFYGNLRDITGIHFQVNSPLGTRRDLEP